MADASVQRVAEALGREQTVRGLLEAATRELVDVLDASACLISRVVGDLLVSLVEFSRDERTLGLGHEYLISDYPLTKEVVTEGRPRAVSLLEAEPEPNEAELLEQLGYESLLMTCLPSNGQCWGLVEVYLDRRRFDQEQAAIAREIAAITGKQLERLEGRPKT
ncbi:MAG TPA: GAF domain-containing protein [Gaiellaceae bacterium]|nr:GAF domain-containing protein [Gaiellaceae bacterium]